MVQKEFEALAIQYSMKYSFENLLKKVKCGDTLYWNCCECDTVKPYSLKCTITTIDIDFFIMEGENGIRLYIDADTANYVTREPLFF